MRSITHHRLVLITMITVLLTGIPMGTSAQSRPEAADPTAAAVFYSQLEAEGRFSELYSYMHPDAQEIIPEAAIVGWYENEFAPLGPSVITVMDVQLVSWVWE